MHDIDHTIKELWGQDDAHLFEAFGAQSLRERIAESFRGESRWLVALGFVTIIAFLALALLSARNFLQATELRDALVWGGAAAFCVLSIGLTKIWYWMELNKNSVVREVNRLELEVAWLSHVNRGPDSGGWG